MKQTTFVLGLAMLSFVMTVIWGPPLLRILRHYRIGKLIRLLGSDKPGEVIAAVDALVRSLHAAGSDIHRLAEIAESGLSSAPKSTFSDTDERPDWREILA